MESSQVAESTARLGAADAEQRYARLLASVDGIVWEADARSFQFTFVSQQAERLLGYPVSAWLAPGFWAAHLHPDDRAWAVDYCRSATAEGRNHDFEYRMIAADGRVVWLRDIVGVNVEGGAPTTLHGIMVDVTGRRRAEQELCERDQLHRLITEHSSDLVALLDLEGRTVYRSASMVRLLGEGEGTRFVFERVHPDDLGIARRAWEEVLAGEPALVSLRYRDQEHDQEHPDWRWLEASATRVEHRGAAHVLVVCRDASERKLAEAQHQAHLRLLESMDRINRAIHGAPDLERMMVDVLDVVLDVFACDRAWLLHPCDPDASVWEVPMERTRPEWPGLYSIGRALPVDDDVAFVFRTARSSPGPVAFGDATGRPIPTAVAEAFGVKSQLVTAVYPTVGRPYLFGLHQCSYHRHWTSEDERLFQETGRRIADALSTFLSHRALRESQAELEAAQRIAHVGHWERDLLTDRSTWSDETCRIYGVEPGSGPIPRARLLELIHPDDRQRIEAAIATALAGGARYDIEHRVLRPDGELRIVHSQADVQWDEAGRAVRMFGTVQDITGRREAEDRVRASEARFRTLVEHATDAFFLHDTDGTVLDVNDVACEGLGYEREELIGMNPVEFDPHVDVQTLAELTARLDAGEVIEFETRHRRKDGTVFPVEVRVRPFTEAGRRYAVSLVRDITERKRAEQALIESHALLQAVVEGSSDAIFVKDCEGRYLMINSTGARNLGLPVGEILGKSDGELFPAAGSRAMGEDDHRIMASGAAELFEETHTTGGVTRTYLTTKAPYRDARGEVLGVIGIARDITELKRMEEQFRQAQKMEAVGRLAGGVAHDFNNLLTVISGCCDLVLEELAPDDANRELIGEARQAAFRAAGLTRQLLAFSRKQVLQPRPVEVNRLLQELLKLLQRLIGEDIDVRLIPDLDLAWAHVDPGHLEQAIINLAVNARDAMPTGGRLTIQTRNVQLGEEVAELHPDVEPGPYVQVSVADSGHGIDEDATSRIFEPFFTTKGPGEGTGLGLAMVYGFVKQSGGHVDVESRPGLGTTFRLFLPHAEEAPRAAGPAPEPRRFSRGTETVLLVEDEDSIRRLAGRTLRAHGYTVLEARDGQVGVQLARNHPGPIDLVLTDLVMPGMSGRELADLLARSRPGARTLFMSGYSAEAVTRHGVAADHITLLPKPFSPTELVQKVREVLDGCDERR